MQQSGWRPTAEELSELTEAFGRDPLGSFVSLGQAYLALGRAKDAIEVGAQGLHGDPDNVDGRMMVAQAFASLHQWREAQAELLKVVKANRNHIDGFRMLGEVLMRQDDYDRAMPVLQHAQNLAPADSDVLTLLRHARARERLHPAPPVPARQAPGAGPDSHASTAEPMTREASDVVPPPREQRATGSRRSVRPDPQPPPGGRVRPRVVSNQKPVGVAQASLRMSAAAGEQHLPALLSGGLLELPNVKAARLDYHVAPVKRWGRSLVQFGMTIGVVLGLCAVGGAGWFWFTKTSEARLCEADVSNAERAISDGRQSVLVEGTGLAQAALERCPSSGRIASLWARNSDVRALLFGDVPEEDVNVAIERAMSAEEPDESGHLLVARAAAVLAGNKKAGEVEALVQALGALPADNKVAGWMLAKLHIARGDRAQARKALEAAVSGAEGLPLATLELGFFFLDDGDVEEALKIFERLLTKEEVPALAYLGRAQAMVEQGTNIESVMRDINVNAAGLEGARVEAQRGVVLAGASIALQDHEGANEAVANIETLVSQGWRSRAAVVFLALGRLDGAVSLRKPFGEAPLAPLMRTVDADILWHQGKPRSAEKKLGKAKDMRSELIRGKALFDRERYGAAGKAFEAARRLAPEYAWALIWSEATRLIAAKDAGKRETAEANLRKLVLQTNDKAARFVHGAALLAIDRAGDARRTLESSVEDISTEEPNTLLWQSQTALARAYLREGKTKKALVMAEKAAGAAPDRAASQEVLCRALARAADDKARDACAGLIERDPSPSVLVAWAMVVGRGDRDKGKSVLLRAQKKGASPRELAVGIRAIDSALFQELGVPSK